MCEIKSIPAPQEKERGFFEFWDKFKINKSRQIHDQKLYDSVGNQKNKDKIKEKNIYLYTATISKFQQVFTDGTN